MTEFSNDDDGSARLGEELADAARRLDRLGEALRRAGTAPIGLDPAATRAALLRLADGLLAGEAIAAAYRETGYSDPTDIWFERALEKVPNAGYRLLADTAYQLARHAEENPAVTDKLTRERARTFLKSR